MIGTSFALTETGFARLASSSLSLGYSWQFRS